MLRPQPSTPSLFLNQTLPGAHADLKNFLNVAFDAAGAAGKIIDGLQNLADFFNGNFDSLPFLGTKIPVINQSLADLLNVGNSFQKVVDAFKANPTDSVQGLRNRLIEALNLPTDTNGVDDPTEDDLRLARLVEQCAYGVLTWAVAGEITREEAVADVRRACLLLLA